ncbi:ribonuclease, T2 family [Dictyocaulus viviparus]|uniref:Ribonuclease, T2 family n=1 Tax=Dictyocaulus viviparus TaxID=29172 RepID=A0A0D8XT59_DICVI|nr:ribonuclease, T2 family [Dictyocaulus viviparus]
MWPNLYPTKSVQSLWKHEWEKHGTCAESHKNLSSEFLYFNVTLQLDKTFAVEAALKRAGIIPRNQPYELKIIQNALENELTNGARVQINCLTDKKTQQMLLGDVRMCVNKSFQTVNCPHSKSLQPIIHILGESPPLPSFHECPPSVIYLSDISSKALKIGGVEHKEITFWINPFITAYASLFSNERETDEYKWRICLPFIAIVMLIYFESRRSS